jgi:hypothetical protein
MGITCPMIECPPKGGNSSRNDWVNWSIPDGTLLDDRSGFEPRSERLQTGLGTREVVQGAQLPVLIERHHPAAAVPDLAFQHLATVYPRGKQLILDRFIAGLEHEG